MISLKVLYYSLKFVRDVFKKLSGLWKLIHFFADDRAELYNLREDIGEKTNLALTNPDKAAALRARLEAFLAEGATGKVLAFAEEVGYIAVDFPAMSFDPFFNINTPEDLAKATAFLEAWH